MSGDDHKPLTLAALAEAIGARLEGDPDTEIDGVATLTGAGERQVSFFHNRRYRSQLAETRAAAVILADEQREHCRVSALVHPNPYLAYARAATLLQPQGSTGATIAQSAVIAPDAQIGDDVSVGPCSVIESGVVIGEGSRIGPGCVIGRGTTIGKGCLLAANITLCHEVILGDRVQIHPGAVIGADGFGLAPDNGAWVKVPQLGRVVIGNDVEIGANTTIDRGALEDTRIGNGVKIDNLVQIAHNVEIGDHTAIAGCVGIAGSATIGSRCQIGGGAGILGHLQIADGVVVTATSLVDRSLDTAGVYSSSLPVQDNRHWKRNAARLRHLDQWIRSGTNHQADKGK